VTIAATASVIAVYAGAEIAAGVVDFCIGVEAGANRGGEADVEKCADVPGRPHGAVR
jgi:hypothetical protein